jgi:hypothetical protein
MVSVPIICWVDPAIALCAQPTVRPLLIVFLAVVAFALAL